MRKLLVGLALLVLIAAPVHAELESDGLCTLFSSGHEIVTDVPAFASQGYLMIPVSAVAEELGFDVTFDAATNSAWLRRDPYELHLVAGQRQAMWNGKPTELAYPVTVQSGRMFITQHDIFLLGARIRFDGYKPEAEIFKVAVYPDLEKVRVAGARFCALGLLRCGLVE